MQIKIQSNPSEQILEPLNVFSWPIWEKEISEFPWRYEQTETCYFLTGRVTVTTETGETISMGKGDLVTFPKGLQCTWQIHEAVQKHYNFSD